MGAGPPAGGAAAAARMGRACAGRRGGAAHAPERREQLAARRELARGPPPRASPRLPARGGRRGRPPGALAPEVSPLSPRRVPQALPLPRPRSALRPRGAGGVVTGGTAGGLGRHQSAGRRARGAQRGAAALGGRGPASPGRPAPRFLPAGCGAGGRAGRGLLRADPLCLAAPRARAGPRARREGAPRSAPGLRLPVRAGVGQGRGDRGAPCARPSGPEPALGGREGETCARREARVLDAWGQGILPLAAA